MILALFAFIIIIYVILIFNQLVFLDNITKNAKVQVDIKLKLRNDLLPLLISIVKKYSAYEKSVFKEVTNLRNGKNISNSLKQLFVNVESYPKLKADKSFLRLQFEITELESNIAFKRQFYNDSVNKYNNLAMSFPSNIVAKIFRYGLKKSFVNDSEFGGIKF